MKTLIMMMGLLLTMNAYPTNLGHRAGGDYFKHMPENSLVILKESLTGAEGGYALQFNKDFDYLEFDVYETKDHVPVVFHSSTIKRMIPHNVHNMHAYEAIRVYRSLYPFKDLRIRHLTLQELKTFRLRGDYDQSVPTVQEFLDLCRDLKLRKPMIIELKYIFSSMGRQALFDMVKDYNNHYAKHANIIYEKGFNFGEGVTTAFLGSKRNFDRSLGADPKKWCQLIINAGLHGVFKPYKHKINYCKY